jgi:hypothetical protein
MSRTGAATAVESGSPTNLPPAMDTKAWQTALAKATTLAEAKEGGGPLTPAVFYDGAGNTTKSTPGMVIEFGRDSNTGADNPNRAATALVVFPDEKGQPQGAVFLDKATNTATSMQFNTHGSLVSSYTFEDKGGNVPPPPGSNATNTDAAYLHLWGQDFGAVIPNDPQDASISVGDSKVDVADSVGDPTQVNNPGFLAFISGSSMHPYTSFTYPSAGIGAEVDTPAGSVQINSSSGINPDPTDTSRMSVVFTSGLTQSVALYSESPALPQKTLKEGPAPSGVESRYDQRSFYYVP